MELNVVGDKKSVSYRMRAGTNLEDVASAVRETWLYGGDEPEKLDIEPYDAYQRELEDFIGQGGMSLVYRAVDIRTGHSVAVKIPQKRIQQ